MRKKTSDNSIHGSIHGLTTTTKLAGVGPQLSISLQQPQYPHFRATHGLTTTTKLAGAARTSKLGGGGAGPQFFFFLCCKPIGARRQFQGIHYRTLMVGCSSPVSSLQGPGGKYWLVDLAALCLTLPLFVALSRGLDTFSVLFCLKLALLAYTGQCCFTLFYSV